MVVHVLMVIIQILKDDLPVKYTNILCILNTCLSGVFLCSLEYEFNLTERNSQIYLGLLISSDAFQVTQTALFPG